MLRYIVRRLLQSIPVLVLISVATFVLMRVVIGDPIQLILGNEANGNAQTVERLRHQLGLDRPLPVQYIDWVGHLLTGDFGRSMRMPMPVSKLILQRLPVTLELTLLALVLAVVIAIPLGVLAVLRPSSLLDLTVSGLASISLSIPNFFLGLLLILLFALQLGWLPSSGYVSFTHSPVQNLKFMILPTLTLTTGYVGTFTRYMRAAMFDVLEQDYIRTARAKGLRPSIVLYRHALRNAVMPVITIIGLAVAGLFGGAVVTETIFSLPGVGTLLLEAISGRDLTTVQALILVIAVGVVLVNLVTDLAYALIDPRIRETYG